MWYPSPYSRITLTGNNLLDDVLIVEDVYRGEVFRLHGRGRETLTLRPYGDRGYKIFFDNRQNMADFTVDVTGYP